MFDVTTIQAIARQAKRANIPFAALAAVVEVESGGKTGSMVAGQFEPLIRFEGHYFYKRVVAFERERAIKMGLASPKAGVVKNPNSQTSRYAMLNKAAGIDRQAAYESTSWGVGQVMGAHWKALGYSSVVSLTDDARSGVEGQVGLMVRFILMNALDKHLRAGNFRAFARAYNGTGYAKNAYDTKMFAAEKRWASYASSNPHVFDDAKAAPDVPEIRPAPPAATPSLTKPPKVDWSDPAGIPDLDKPIAKMTTIWGAASALVSAIAQTFADLPPVARYVLLAVAVCGLGWIIRERLRRRQEQRALSEKVT
jgi:hypothetical protein